MERLRRALDLARQQRDGAGPVFSAVPSAAPVPPVPAPSAAARTSNATMFAQPSRDEVDLRGESSAGVRRGGPDREREDPGPAFPRVYAAIDRNRLRARHVVFPEDAGAAAHAYRMLRTQLRHRADRQPIRTIGVVSAVEGEGKTLTAINLALSLAADPDSRVLLADLDLRRPSLATVLGLAPGQGLETWVTGGMDLADACCGLIGIERLVVVPTRAAVPGSPEVLAGARGRLLLSGLRACAGDGMVLLDLPPALLADDALAIAPALDGVLLVVAERRTRREDFTRMRELLAGVPVLGTVLNASVESEQRVY